MSPWTALLESLHSAFIDELVERHPEPKPELGMPTRHSAWAAPFDGSEHLLLRVKVSLGGKQGFAFLALEPSAEKLLGGNSGQFCLDILNRAGSEFARRGIQPEFSTPTLLPSEKVTAEAASLTRLIWVPVRLNTARAALGVAI